VDECVFYFGRSVLLVYVDDSILMGPKEEELNYLIAEMNKRFKLQEEGSVSEFLGIEIQREDDGGIPITATVDRFHS